MASKTLNRKFYFVLAVIMFLGLLVRVIWLNRAPPSLNWDEVAQGYNAYSLMLTGKDEFGNTLPIVLRSFDDYKPALYAYISIPFIKLFGLTEFSTRIVSAISGTALIAITSLLAFHFTNKKRIALLAAFLIAFEPWSVHFSRAAFASNLGLVLFLAGLLFLLKDRLKTFNSTIGLSIMALSLYAYPAYKILFPLVVIYFLIDIKNDVIKNPKTHLLKLILPAIILIPIALLHLTNPEATGRLGSTWIDQNGNMPFFTLINQIATRFVSYFSPASLFVRGTTEPTQTIFGFGMFHYTEFIFWVVGIFTVFKNYKKHKDFIFLLFISLTPAIITWNWFYPARILTYLALTTILISTGFFKTWNLFKNKKRFRFLFFSASIVLTISLIIKLMTTQLFYMPLRDGGAWQKEMKTISQNMAKHEKDYSTVIIETGTAQPHIFTLFYTKFPPDRYHSFINVTGGVPVPRESFDFDKFVFRPVYWLKDNTRRDTLFVSKPSSLPLDQVKQNEHVNLIEEIKDTEGNTILHIVGVN